MKYSYFDSIKSRSCHQVSVGELQEIISSERIKKTAADIIHALADGDEKRASELKAQLPVIVLGQLYEEGQPRSKDGGKPTGALMIDYDSCSTTDEALELMNEIKAKWLSDINLQELILAVHFSPRMHGVHVWYRWIDGCHSYAECNDRIARLLNRTDYDIACKDNSRCSFLVPSDYFEIMNFDGLDKNEAFAKLQEEQEGDPSPVLPRGGGEQGVIPSGGLLPLGGDGQSPERGRSFPTTYEEVPYTDIVAALVRQCAPKNHLDDDGSVREGARDNSFFKVACLLRYICDNNAEWLYSLAPSWAHDLGDSRLMELCRNACKRNLSYSFPKTLTLVLQSFKEEDAMEALDAEREKAEEDANKHYMAQLEGIEESKRKFLFMPEKLPPIFQEYCDSVKPEWKAAVICTLLPTLGTLMSKLRARYSDGELHSPSFQTVIEAKMASGKSVYTRIAKTILSPIIAMDLEGNTKLNLYNQEAVKANGSKQLGDMPDVCVRMMNGMFTEAGFNTILDTSKGLHVWSGVSEIDQVYDSWKSLSYILRLAYDNEQYQRTLQSIKQFRGSRPLYLNTFLCGTPHAVRRVYNDPEDGLVSRTIFFKHMVETPGMPLSKISKRDVERILKLCKKIHDKYCINDQYEVAHEQEISLSYVCSHLDKWSAQKSKEATKYGSESLERFRRRDAVNGFRAAMVAHCIYLNMGKKITPAERKVVKDFAEWVAEYSLMMHDYKFGKELNIILAEDEMDSPTTKTPLLDALPDTFSLAEAYRTFAGRAPSSIRAVLSRMVNAGLLVREERGLFTKK